MKFMAMFCELTGNDGRIAMRAVRDLEIKLGSKINLLTEGEVYLTILSTGHGISVSLLPKYQGSKLPNEHYFFQGRRIPLEVKFDYLQ